MLALMIIGGIVLIILFVIYLEYRNEKKYQEERRRYREKKKKKLSPKVTTRPKRTEREIETPPPHHREDKNKNKQKPVVETAPPKRESVSVETPKTVAPLKEETKPHISEPEFKKETPSETQKVEKEEEKIDLPKGEYPAFNYDRLIEMGLTEEEAHEFVQELIPQIGEQIPLIDEAMKIPDFHQMERLTHSIKGSSTNIGTGGVSDLLVDYNTYLKSGEEIRIAEAYQKHLKHYYEKLKKQFQKD